MPKVMDAAKAAEKFATVAAQRSQDYVEGVQNPRNDWATATKAAEQAFKDGVSQAIAQGRFGKGVQRAGSAKQIKGAVDKGANRFASGVVAGKDNYAQGVAPYLSTIASTTLPPRYARRDPRNLERVRVITTALGAKKIAGGG